MAHAGDQRPEVGSHDVGAAAAAGSECGGGRPAPGGRGGGDGAAVDQFLARRDNQRFELEGDRPAVRRSGFGPGLDGRGTTFVKAMHLLMDQGL